MDPLSLNGSWAFRFEEGALLADAAKPDFDAAGTIPVPACFDAMPDWLLKRGVGLYRRSFRLDRDVPAAWLRVDGMGLVGSFFLDGRPLGTSALPYSALRLPTGPLAAGEHTLAAALGNRFDEPRLALARPYYDFYLYGGFYHGVSLAFDDRALRVRTRDIRDGTVEIEAVNVPKPDFDATLLFDGRRVVAAVNDALCIEAPTMPDGEDGLAGIDEKHFKQIASLMEDFTLDFESATQAARAQLNPLTAPPSGRRKLTRRAAKPRRRVSPLRGTRGPW